MSTHTTAAWRQVRQIVMLALLLLILLPTDAVHAQSTERAPDGMAARVLACTACHGVAGRGTNNESFPRLAGKPAGYLYNQLVAFRNGRRRYPPMNYLLAFLPDAYLQAIAGYFAGEDPPLPPPTVPIVSKDILAVGKSIVTSGDPNRGIPACSGCHNPTFTGMEPAIPGLLGLPPSYITAQLGAWRYGTRTAAAPDCMQVVASHLTEEDVTAVAAWIATLPAPPNATPVLHGSLPMPLPCGSEPN
jgi:cytochrome c553